MVCALTSGCAWRRLPPPFGTSPATAHRRFTVWTEAGLWRRLHRAVLDELGARGEVDWTSAAVDAASVRLFLADGEAAVQEVFHVHLHVFPRFADDGFRIDARWRARDRHELDNTAAAVRTGLSELNMQP
ncbi:transposase [Streptomyces acidicola]|uniref:transposase n=1 Tax=Streptomyces acidicola TaxID=2596892 RepID=UPI002AD3BBDB|nr:transposase [Streptomyces acidicola]